MAYQQVDAWKKQQEERSRMREDILKFMKSERKRQRIDPVDANYEYNLVSLVLLCPPLYDPHHSYYHDLITNDEAWEEIGLKLGKTGEACNRAWEVIKDRWWKRKYEHQNDGEASTSEVEPWSIMEKFFLDANQEPNRKRVKKNESVLSQAIYEDISSADEGCNEIEEDGSKLVDRNKDYSLDNQFLSIESDTNNKQLVDSTVDVTHTSNLLPILPIYEYHFLNEKDKKEFDNNNSISLNRNAVTEVNKAVEYSSDEFSE